MEQQRNWRALALVAVLALVEGVFQLWHYYRLPLPGDFATPPLGAMPLYALAHLFGANAWFVFRLLNVLLFAGFICMLYMLGREAGGNQASGLATAFIGLGYPAFAYWLCAWSPALLFLLLTTLVTWLSLRILFRPSFSSSELIALAMFCVWGGLIRPVSFAVLLLVAILLLLKRGHARQVLYLAASSAGLLLCAAVLQRLLYGDWLLFSRTDLPLMRAAGDVRQIPALLSSQMLDALITRWRFITFDQRPVLSVQIFPWIQWPLFSRVVLGALFAFGVGLQIKNWRVVFLLVLLLVRSFFVALLNQTQNMAIAGDVIMCAVVGAGFGSLFIGLKRWLKENWRGSFLAQSKSALVAVGLSAYVLLGLFYPFFNQRQQRMAVYWQGKSMLLGASFVGSSWLPLADLKDDLFSCRFAVDPEVSSPEKTRNGVMRVEFANRKKEPWGETRIDIASKPSGRCWYEVVRRIPPNSRYIRFTLGQDSSPELRVTDITYKTLSFSTSWKLLLLGAGSLSGWDADSF